MKTRLISALKELLILVACVSFFVGISFAFYNKAPDYLTRYIHQTAASDSDVLAQSAETGTASPQID